MSLDNTLRPVVSRRMRDTSRTSSSSSTSSSEKKKQKKKENSEQTTEKKKFSNIEDAYQKFKDKMTDLRKEQASIIKDFSHKAEAKKLEEKGIYFVGRLANYKYFNMDQAFKSSLDLFSQIS
jgi:UDP-galactopyranose mutase